MVELTYVGGNTAVASGANVPFNSAMKTGCNERYRNGSSQITLLKPGKYLVSASANIASGTAGDVVSLGITLDGEVVNGTVMTSSPATAGAYNSVSAQTYVEVYPCCCATVALENAGTTALSVNSQNLTAIKVGGIYNA